MADLIGYLQASTLPNTHSTSNLVKARCGICRKEYGSVEEAVLCEQEHLREMIGDVFTENIDIDKSEV